MAERRRLSEEALKALSVHERCAEKFGGVCVKIYAQDAASVIRTEKCRYWCPLLKELIR